jgi:hypothetical protein
MSSSSLALSIPFTFMPVGSRAYCLKAEIGFLSDQFHLPFLVLLLNLIVVSFVHRRLLFLNVVFFDHEFVVLIDPQGSCQYSLIDGQSTGSFSTEGGAVSKTAVRS